MTDNEAESNLIPKLYKVLSVRDIDSIQVYFKNLTSDGLSYEQFRQLLLAYNIHYRDSNFEHLCLKIDLDRDSRINFHEFIGYFISELRNDDNAAERLLVMPPIAKSPKVLSTSTSVHRNRIVRVFSIPDGRYLTMGCYGDTYIWSSKWKFERIVQLDTIPATTSSTIELSDMRKIKKSPLLLIVDAIVMINMNIICISSTCCDLRFYDIANCSNDTVKCNLRLYIRNFPSPLSCFHHHYHHAAAADDDDDDDEENRLIFGDFVGSVRVIDFTKNFKLQFRMGSMIRQISYHELMKGQCETTMKCQEYVKLHSDIIRQVFYVRSINGIISASESTMTKNLYLPGIIITTQQAQNVFTMRSGTTCFAFDESSQTLATGGPDCDLRLWNIMSPKKPKSILYGHTSGISSIFIQDGEKIYSIDKQLTINVWDIHDESLLQSFAGLKPIFPQDSAIITHYNEAKRELIVAERKITIIKCNPRIRPDKCDGISHTKPITLILLNKLFHFLVSCGSDSTMIVWDIWNGRKVNWIIRAHTALRHGETHMIAITAGCFDTRHQYMLTGGVDGSLKIWNVNEGICVRSLSVDASIVSLFWTNKRILVVSELSMTEFQDSNDYKEQINSGKMWQQCHSGKIQCASLHASNAIVTSCSHGDVIFWHYETGHPYMRFNLNHPERRMTNVYAKLPRGDEKLSKSSQVNNKSANNANEILTSHCMLSLNNRPLNVSNGTLLVSLSNGSIQVWSHHHNTECYITDFNAIHMTGDVITAMTTDTKNCYLFTGSSQGYIKAWMIVNFCLSSSIEEDISVIKLHSRFPFLQRDEFEGGAKRAVRDQLQPLLLNSYQGHKAALISGLIYSETNQILISSSEDKSVRLWDLSGKYINTIGSYRDWHVLSPNEPLPPDFNYNFPADLRNVISLTTMRVLEGGITSTRNADELLKAEREATNDGDNLNGELLTRILKRPVARQSEQGGGKSLYEKPTLDISLPHIPIYRHLRIHRTVPINLPRTIPKCLDTNDLPNLENISHLEPEEIK